MEMTWNFVTIICTISVTVAQKDIRIPPNIESQDIPYHIIYRSDERIEMPCTATGYPQPTYEWMKNGLHLDTNAPNIQINSDPNGSALVINPLISLDEGYYQCRATNIYGMSLSKVFFLQRAVLGRFPPRDIEEYPTKEGQPLRLTCFDVKSIPKPTYSWSLADYVHDENPVPLQSNRRIIKDDDGHLYFSYTTKEDASSKLYACSAFNRFLDVTVGGHYTRVIVNEADVSPKVPTLMYVSPSPYITVKGSSIRIQCIFSGMPEVTVTWEPIPAGRGRLDESGTILEIDDVQFSDGGRYDCNGTNTAGVASYFFTVIVQAAPEFEMRPSNMNATEGDTVQFVCTTRSDTIPPATIQWFINGQLMDSTNPGPRTAITDDGRKLTFSDVCKDCADGGSDLKAIQCNVSNVHGYVFADAYLNVLLRTVITVAPQDKKIDNETDLVVLQCEATSDPSTPVHITWTHNDKELVYNDDNRMEVNVATNSLNINLDGLGLGEKKKYEGTYSCVASNGYSREVTTAKLTLEGYQVLTTPVDVGPVPTSGSSTPCPMWYSAGLCVVTTMVIRLLQ